MKTDFAAILEQYGKSINVERLSLDEQGSCMIGLEDVLVSLIWIEKDDYLHICAPVGPWGEVDDEECFCRELLTIGASGHGKGGFSVGLDQEFGVLTLSLRIPGAALTPASIQEFITAFVVEASGLQARIELLQQKTVAPNAEAISSIGMDILRV